MKRIADKNKVNRSFIGMGYYDTKTPAVILRNVLENPGWYTQYTPYQPEVAQGRLESLMNFQTMISDLTGFELCNASLLDESTAAAEAMSMIFAAARKKPKFFVDDRVHPQTLAVVETRAAGLGVTVVTGDYASFAFDKDVCGALVQYPATDGSAACSSRRPRPPPRRPPLGLPELGPCAGSGRPWQLWAARHSQGRGLPHTPPVPPPVSPPPVSPPPVALPLACDPAGSVLDYTGFAAQAKEAGAKLAVATDLLGLTVLQPPSLWGADIAVGSAQRFGVPLGYGGPHAGFLSTNPDMVRGGWGQQ